MKFFTYSTTRRVALIVVRIRDGRACFARPDAARPVAVGRDRQLAAAPCATGRPLARKPSTACVSTSRADKAPTSPNSMRRSRASSTTPGSASEIGQTKPSTDVIGTELLAAGVPDRDVTVMVAAVRWVRFLPDYESAMVSWAAFDHQVARLTETANDLRYRRERNAAAAASRACWRASIGTIDCCSSWPTTSRRRCPTRRAGSTIDWRRRRWPPPCCCCRPASRWRWSWSVASRRSERARADSDQRYQALVTQDAVGIWQHSRDGQVLFANPALLRMFGVDRLTALRPWERFFSAENLEVIRREQEKQLDGIASTFEVEIQPAGGNDTVRLLISGSPVSGRSRRGAEHHRHLSRHQRAVASGARIDREREPPAADHGPDAGVPVDHRPRAALHLRARAFVGARDGARAGPHRGTGVRRRLGRQRGRLGALARAPGRVGHVRAHRRRSGLPAPRRAAARQRRNHLRHHRRQPRHHRAQELRSAARAPGEPRPAHRPLQPAALRGGARSRGRRAA